MAVVWPDGHRSSYDLKWLRYHSYDPKLPGGEEYVKTRAKVHWNADIAKTGHPMVKYADVMAGDAGLTEWLKRIVGIWNAIGGR